jgi:leucyl aminopeptidase
MNQDIDVKIKLKQGDHFAVKSDILIVCDFTNTKRMSGTLQTLDHKLGGTLTELKNLNDYSGKKNTHVLLYSNGGIAPKRVLIMGLGDKSKLSLETVRQALAGAAKKAVSLEVSSLTVAIHQDMPRSLDACDLARVLAESICFGAYSYDEFITSKQHKRAKHLTMEMIVDNSADSKGIAASLRIGSIVGHASNYARTIANRPANVITPQSLAALSRQMAKSYPSLSCTVMTPKQLAEKGMGGILAVGAGSRNTPRLIVLKHTPKSKRSQARPAVALVGKAITFDSGGISIKPAANMDQMKFDKTGGVSVIATMKAIAELDLDLPVCGIVPSAENMPGGASYRPGDIVTTYSGKTVEIINTDAEGRMILSDGIAYAKTLKCDTIIDIATLTGACMVALGQYKAGLMGNNDELLKQLQAASKASGETVWHLPCDEPYADEMKSKVADLKNCGSRWGGASTAAAFLRQFAGEQCAWAHIDIAGMDVFQNDSEARAPGSSGFGVRLLTMFLLSHSRQK